MLNQIFKIIRVNYSSKYAMKVANEYWKNTTVTHSSMQSKDFNFYFKALENLIAPNHSDNILDFGGGNGEIAALFMKNNYNISHCDINPEMVENASNKKIKTCLCKHLPIRQTYDIIFVHNAIFYIHPKQLKQYIKQLTQYLNKGGKIYLTDSPDYDKRSHCYNSTIKNIITRFFPVYQANLGGFFIKTNTLKSISNNLGFKIQKLDSWVDYRSHWVLTQKK